MRKKKKIILISILVIVLILLGVGGYYFFFRQKPVDSPIKEVKVTNEITEYGYKLDDRDTKIFKEKWNELKELLSKEEIDENEYASLVSQLFIIDLYTIDNKISKYDIGGLEYVYEPAKESFKSVVMDTIYKNVINNVDKKREQTLPIVETITPGTVTKQEYELPDETTKESYIVPIKWTYETDLGYDNEGTIELIKNENRIDVVSFEPEN